MTKQRLIGALLVLTVILITALVLVKNANDNIDETAVIDLPDFESSIQTVEPDVIDLQQEALIDPHSLGDDVAAAIESDAVKEAVTAKAKPATKVIVVPPVADPKLVEEPKPGVEQAIAKKTVSAPVKKTAPTSKAIKAEVTGSQWVIQLASFGVKSNAEAMQKKVKKLGYESRIEALENSQGKMIYRVKIGPESDRQKVDEIVSKAKQHLRLSPQVIKL